MEQFNPALSIVAVDENDAVVTFDFASASDSERAPKALRIPRKFNELSIAVTAFESLGELGDRKEYRGSIKLTVKPLEGDAIEHVLAEPRLWIDAESRNRKKGAHPFNFHSTDAVTRAVRVGVANALSRALGAFYAKEAHIDTLARSPAQPVTAAAPVADVRPASGIVGAIQSFAAPATAANDDPAEKKRFRKKVIFAAIATPLVVFALLTAGGALKKNDPIQDAVAKAMTQNPSSTQAQVELTKETLKQMGLDPGKSGDIGCLAPN